MSEILKKLKENPTNCSDDYYLKKLFDIKKQLQDELNEKLDICFKLKKVDEYYNNEYSSGIISDCIFELDVERLLKLIEKIDLKIYELIKNTLNIDFDDCEDSSNFILKYIYDIDVK